MRGVKVAVVGAGPAGSSAAIQLRKEDLDLVIFERKGIGGLLRYANSVDNLLGHKGRSGTEICRLIEEHLINMDIAVIRSEVTEILADDLGFTVKTSEGPEPFTHLILSTGSVPNQIDIPGCLYHIEDPSLFESERVLIVGGGDLAFDNALRLSENEADVTIMVRNTPSANRGLRRSVMESGIEVVIGDSGDLIRENGVYSLPDGSAFDHIAAFIGRTPERDLIRDLGDIRIDHPTGRTSVKGLYVIGDAALGTLSQTALASGMGLAAAMDIARLVRD